MIFRETFQFQFCFSQYIIFAKTRLSNVLYDEDVEGIPSTTAASDKQFKRVFLKLFSKGPN